MIALIRTGRHATPFRAGVHAYRAENLAALTRTVFGHRAEVTEQPNPVGERVVIAPGPRGPVVVGSVVRSWP